MFFAEAVPSEQLAKSLPTLLGIAWLLPLASFVIVLFFGPRLGKHGKGGAYVATGAILGSFVCSAIALFSWIGTHGISSGSHDTAGDTHTVAASTEHPASSEHAGEHGKSDHGGAPHGHHEEKETIAYTADWYTLGSIGDKLKLTIGYYIDALSVTMFAMVTLIASCIHFYAMGYMHDELHDITDHEVTLTGNPYDAEGHGDSHGHDSHAHAAPAAHGHDSHGHDSHGHDAHGHGGHGHGDHGHGNHLVRPGRFHRFFQYLSLFCFSMLGLVYAGNIAMVFVFWELVGICSYFLIGFYRERKSASNAANKAFIVNRVGDFGMLIGLMALWTSLGTFNFGDIKNADGHAVPGMFSLVRPAGTHHALQVPDGMVRQSAKGEIATIVNGSADAAAAEALIQSNIPGWRNNKVGYWLLVVAGLGIFCGCVGKSAQFPLHVWLPDAMEGPTPVSALVHSATMVAAGVYLVARFFPVFAPEALLVIACVGAITLFIAATIAITATDIKRVLAYSTVSQLGYMMLALGLGGWIAGVFHLITHAFFKSLLFMCSGSVIHACHTNEMTKMGGLRHKMPWTAYTMLIGCLAIAGAGIPLIGPGFSGYYSKDAIIEQAVLFGQKNNGLLYQVLCYAPAVGAAITAFYMFRMWFMTFAGPPRDEHIYDHAHESPPIMYLPLVVLSVFAVAVGWPIFGLTKLLEQARPVGTLAETVGSMWTVVIPNEHDGHLGTIPKIAGLTAFATATAGFLLALFIYGLRKVNPEQLKNSMLPIYGFLRNKWYFDELYNLIFVKPVHFIARRAADFDRNIIDSIVNGSAKVVKGISKLDDVIDRFFVDGIVNGIAGLTKSIGGSLRNIQTGSLRQYIQFIVVGTVVMFVIITLMWRYGSF